MKSIDAETKAIATRIQKQIVASGEFVNVSRLRQGTFQVTTDVGQIAVDVFASTRLQDDHKFRFRLVNNDMDRSMTVSGSLAQDALPLLRKNIAFYKAELAKREAERVALAAVTARRNAIRDAIDLVLRREGALAKIQVDVVTDKCVVLRSGDTQVQCPPAKVEVMVRAMLACEA